MKRYDCIPFERWSPFLIVTCFLLPGTLAAQDAAETNIFGGYSFIKTDPGIDGLDAVGAHGFHVEATRFFSPKFGVAAELSGHFGSDKQPLEGIEDLSSNQYSLLVGPRLKSRSFWRIQLSTRGMIGVSTIDIETDGDDTINAVGIDGTETNVAFALGVSVDLKLSEKVSIRLIQSNRFFTFFGNESQSHNRYSSGILIHL